MASSLLPPSARIGCCESTHKPAVVVLLIRVIRVVSRSISIWSCRSRNDSRGASVSRRPTSGRQILNAWFEITSSMSYRLGVRAITRRRTTWLSILSMNSLGKGKRWLSSNKWLGALVGGWQVSGIYYKQSGRAYGDPLGNWFYYGDNLRDLAKDSKDQTTDAWFNWQLLPGATRDYAACTTTAPNACDAWMARASQLVPVELLPSNLTFNKAEVGGGKRLATPTDFQPTNAFHKRVFPQRLNWLRGHGKNQIDTNLLRRFEFKEGKSFEFRLDLINALNHVLWDNPNTDINSSNFGRVTTQWNTPRFVQFQLRLVF